MTAVGHFLPRPRSPYVARAGIGACQRPRKPDLLRSLPKLSSFKPKPTFAICMRKEERRTVHVKKLCHLHVRKMPSALQPNRQVFDDVRCP